MNMSAEALCIDLIIVASACGVILGLAGRVMVELTGGMVGFGGDIFTELCMIVVLATVIALKVVAPVSYAKGLRSGVMIDALAGTVINVAPDIGVDVVATMTALEFIPMLAPSEEILLFGRETCSCWPTAAWNCRALQARMPSCHV